MKHPGQALHARFIAGQSSVEYLVVCAALAIALGVGMAGDDSVLRQLLDAFATWYRRLSFALSVPT